MTRHPRSSVVRTAAVVLLTAVGIVAIVGSGGGVGFPGGDPCANNGCNPGPIYFANVTPARSSVQAGTAVVLSATSLGLTSPTYQWRRSVDGVNFTDIAGQTSASYSFSARLADDGTTYGVRIAGLGGLQATAAAYLAVSSSPAVVFSDSEFADSDWAATSSATSTAASVVSQGQAASGGNPGAWRHTVLSMPSGTSTISVFNVSRLSVFDPALRGALRAIDFTLDCTVQLSTPSTFGTTVLLIQNGRKFAPRSSSSCHTAGWAPLPGAALGSTDFVQVDGPVCGPNEICPDFTASGPQINVGYLVTTTAQGSAAVTTYDRGIDNWKVSLWPR